MVDKRKAAIFVGSVAAAFSICVAAWRFKKNEKKEEPEEKRDNKNVKTSVPLEKPDLMEMVNDSIIRINEYSSGLNDEKPEPEKPAEGDAHICSEQDYIDTYSDYDHHTCTWYPNEKRLVDLDMNFEILVPPEHYIGKMGAVALMTVEDMFEEGPNNTKIDRNALCTMYAVNHMLRTVYEIIVANEDQSYSEDLEDYTKVRDE